MAFKLNLNTTPSNKEDSADLSQFDRQIVSIEELLIYASETNCSDLYIKEYSQPYISRFGKIVRVPCRETSRDEWMKFYDKYIREELNAKYVREKMLDTSTEVKIPETSKYYGKLDTNYFRYRTSLGFSENYRIATFRMIRPEDPTFETINYPQQCKDALYSAYGQKTGIVFFTGATGSGKQLYKDTIIPTISGNKKIEDIQINDIIFDKNGNQTKVIDKYSPLDTKFYELILSDGTKIKAGAGHLWEVEVLNTRAHHNDTRYYIRYLINNNLILALQSITSTNMKLNDYVKYIVNNSNFSDITFRNFLYKYFKDILIRQYDNYIDLNIILNNSIHINATNRINKINTFINNNNKTIINNKEAKEVLGSKFIKIIRQAGIEYKPNKEIIIDAKLLSIMILDWVDNLKKALNSRNETKILTTQDLVNIGIKNNKNRLNFAIRRPSASKYNKVELPLKPYWFGAWLGDGSKWEAEVFGVDLEIGERLKLDYEPRKITISEPRKENYLPITTWHFDSTIRSILTKYNLRGNKYIPDIYKIASIEDKLNLIAGLIDTDGSVDTNGACSIGLINKQIIESLREICCSLGFKCSKIISEIPKLKKDDGTIVICSKVYSFSFYPTVMLPLQVNRKKYNLQNKLNNIQNENIKQQIRHERFYIKDIKEIDGKSSDYYCLAVDSSTHIFLCTESYVPTHNTTTLAACMNTFTRPNGILDNKVIISLEDPIEYTFHSSQSVKFNQKELDKDFKSFASGVKQALREHPNVILVGEARDKEVISAAIEAARTGHIVSTSFHAGDVGGTVSRLLFHLDNSIDLAYDLILNLNIILSQRLLKRDDKYEVDTQYLLFTDYVRKTILKAIQSGQNIQVTVNNLVEDPELQAAKIAKDWAYKN